MDKMTSSEYRNRNYPVREDMHAQRIEWRLQRVGNWLLYAIVAVALLGGFSDGWLSETSRANAQGTMTVEYQRLLRSETDEPFTLRIKGEPNQPVTVRLSGDFMDKFVIQTLRPQPQITHSSTRSLSLTFPATKDGEHAVWLFTQPQTAGIFTSYITLEGTEPVTLKQWVYP